MRASLEQQDHDGSANNSYRAGEASIRSSEERDRSGHHSARRGGLRPEVEQWDEAVRCLSVDPEPRVVSVV